MNTLSWFFYLASVVPSLSALCVLLGLLLLGINLFFQVFYFFETNNTRKVEDTVWTFKFRIPLIAFSMFMVAVLTPSEKTIYMIAASEIGEEVVQSQEAKELYDDLRSIIKGYLKEDES